MEKEKTHGSKKQLEEEIINDIGHSQYGTKDNLRPQDYGEITAQGEQDNPVEPAKLEEIMLDEKSFQKIIKKATLQYEKDIAKKQDGKVALANYDSGKVSLSKAYEIAQGLGIPQEYMEKAYDSFKQKQGNGSKSKGFLAVCIAAGKMIMSPVIGFSLVGIPVGLAYNFFKEDPHRAEYGQGVVIQEYHNTRAYVIDVKTGNGIYSVYIDNNISFLKCPWTDGYKKTAQSLDEELQVGDSIRFVKRYHSPNGTDEFFIRDVRPDSGTSVMSGVVSPNCIEKIQIEKK